MKKLYRILALCMILVLIPGAAFAAGSCMMTNDIASRSFVAGEWGEFGLRTYTNAGDDDYVYVYYAFDEPEVVDAIESYDESTCRWISLDFDRDMQGPLVIWQMSDISTRYRVKFNTAGKHSFGVIVFDAGNTEKVLSFSNAVFSVEESGSAGNSGMHDVICSGCGIMIQVPFEPRGDRPVYCAECFDALRS